MKLCKVKNMAMVSAVALGFAMSGGSAWAVNNCALATAVNIDAQDPTTLNICAQVANTFGTTVDDADFHNIGATGWTGQSGCLIMNNDGTFDETNTACLGSYGVAPVIARIVSEDSAGAAIPGQPGEINITGAFPDQEIRMWFQVQETTNEIAPDAAVGPSLWYTQLTATTDALGVGGLGTNTQDGLWTIAVTDAPEAPVLAAADTAAQNDVAAADGATYKGQTDVATGDLTINIGATIQTDGTFAYLTDGTGSRYATDDFNGTFEVVLFY